MHWRSAIGYWLFPRPRSARGFRCGGGNRFGRRITEGEQSASGFLFLLCAESGHGFTQRFHTEVILALGALDAIEERGQINHLAARVEEVEVQNLLPRHTSHGCCASPFVN